MKTKILCILCVLISSCSQSADGKGFNVMSYNVENLFDDVDDGTEYTEFDPSRGQWNTRTFRTKAGNIAKVILESFNRGPDVLVLCEIENKRTLDLLNEAYLRSCGYRWAVCGNETGSAIHCAVLSRIPVSNFTNHGIYAGTDTEESLRYILEVTLSYDGKTIHLFANHWKSKSGDVAATEKLRIASASALKNRISKILVEDSQANIICAGDFNENPEEFSLNGFSYPTALMLPKFSALSPNSLCVSLDRQDMQLGNDILFSPWNEAEGKGSYYFKGQWEKIDQLLFSFSFVDGKGLELNKFDTVIPKETPADGIPRAFSARTGKGASDHLPIYAVINDLNN